MFSKGILSIPLWSLFFEITFLIVFTIAQQIAQYGLELLGILAERLAGNFKGFLSIGEKIKFSQLLYLSALWSNSYDIISGDNNFRN